MLIITIILKKRYIFSFMSLLSAFVACKHKDIDEGNGNKDNVDELTATGSVSDITSYTTIITGYAYLPFEL